MQSNNMYYDNPDNRDNTNKGWTDMIMLAETRRRKEKCQCTVSGCQGTGREGRPSVLTLRGSAHNDLSLELLFQKVMSCGRGAGLVCPVYCQVITSTDKF